MNYTTDKSLRLTGYADGWYAVAFSSELKPGTVLRRRLMDYEIVVYRTESGKVIVKDAYCPHLGAHLAEGGQVIGEEIQCPFHGFRFDIRGDCVSTPYQQRLPKMCIPGWVVREEFGAVLCFYSSTTREPQWEIQAVDNDNSQLEWSKPACKLWRIRTHPAEIIENTVDTGHFPLVHAYQGIEIHSPLTTRGPYLNMGYIVTRERGLLGRYDPNKMRMHLDINVSGIGYSRVQVLEPKLGIRFRLIVMPTPIDDENVEVRATTQMAMMPKINGRWGKINALIPRRLIAFLMTKVAAKEMGVDFDPDSRIWENKRYQIKPKLAAGDGPIMAYRKWTQQFFTGIEDQCPAIANVIPSVPHIPEVEVRSRGGQCD